MIEIVGLLLKTNLMEKTSYQDFLNIIWPKCSQCDEPAKLGFFKSNLAKLLAFFSWKIGVDEHQLRTIIVKGRLENRRKSHL